MQVFVPVCDLSEPGPHLARRAPSILLSEYGFPVRSPEILEKSEWFISKAMGLHSEKGEVGILIDSSLYKWASFPKSNKEKEEQLSKLPPFGFQL